MVEALVAEPAVSESGVTYFHLTGEAIAWTKEISPSVMVDVDAAGRAIGIETLMGVLDLDTAIKIIYAARFDAPDV